MKENRLDKRFPRVSEFANKIKQPLKKMLYVMGTRAIYSIFISVFTSFIIIITLPFFTETDVFNSFYSNNLGILLAITFAFSFFFLTTNSIMDFYVAIIDSLVDVFASKKAQSRYHKEVDFNIFSLSQKRSLSNFLKFVVIGVLASGSVCAVLLLERSNYGLGVESNLIIGFGLFYFLGGILVVYRKLLMSNSEWVLVNLDDFMITKKREPLKKALLSYNKWLGSCLSLRKILSLTQHVTQAYKIGSDVQKRDLDEQVKKIHESVIAKKIDEIDMGLIYLSDMAKKITKSHKDTLGISVKYPLKLIFWEQTKISLTKNYPKLMYLFLGIILLVVLKYFNLIPPISFP